MKSVIDVGKSGAEQTGDVRLPAAAENPDSELSQLISVIKKFPKQKISANTAEGIQRDVEVRTLPLRDQRVFSLVNRFAAYEPMVFAQQGSRVAEGMLSANFDTHGSDRLPSIKVLTLREPYPLSNDLQPDARMATMLTGAASGERQGVGGHSGNVAADFEHKLTIAGAVSLTNPSLALSHQNHPVRAQSSVATGMTDGRLGSLYTPDQDVSDFPGYGEPLVFEPGQVGVHDAIFVPDSFLTEETGYGWHYSDAPRIMLGAGLQALALHKGGRIGSELEALGQQLGATTYES